MRRFDCLAPDCPLWGNHLLEASAGTGKTFAIEQIVTRMLLESDLSLEKILIVTFTKAATRELKKRIRKNLERVASLEKISLALSKFDTAQIFTIHGFCYRMLQEFAFEAGSSMSLGKDEIPPGFRENLRNEAKLFLETKLDPAIICPEQLTILLKKYEHLGEFAEALLKPMEPRETATFQDLWTQYLKKIKLWKEPLPSPEDLNRTIPSYKSAIKGDFQEQLKALIESVASENPAPFQYLLKTKGSLFHFLSPENRKVKASSELHPFFTWAMKKIAPLIDFGTNSSMLLQIIQQDWKPIESAFLEKEGWIDPDGILDLMEKALSNPVFVSKVASKYAAVFIDEFQDTDPTQWEIFKTLFLQKKLEALYLVGDPKQSIYRFRKADVYTYYQAKELLGPDALFSLDTNFRSTPPLIEALNALFARNWLPLPKTKETIDCIPVKAGLIESSSFEDQKGSIHFLLTSHGPHAFEEQLLPYTALEIERLNQNDFSFAILVKDRYEAALALEMCEQRGLPAVAKTRLPLHETFAFKGIEELFTYLLHPSDQKYRKIMMLSPFASLSNEDLKQGLPFFCHELLKLAPGLEFEEDLRQVIEELLIWESTHGFSLRKAIDFLNTFQFRHSSEAKLKKSKINQNAIQIMTLHMSKGLEFDIVFALGLASRSPNAKEETEEFEAEKLRQLYVAMTRAKKRLYIPAFDTENSSARGSPSPIELFSKSFEVPFISHLSTLKETVDLTFEKIQTVRLEPKKGEIEESKEIKENISLSFQPGYLYSFSSLSPKGSEVHGIEDPISPLDIPRGVQTGTVIHDILETIFSNRELSFSEDKLKTFVQKKAENSFLAPWKEAVSEMIWKNLSTPFDLGGIPFAFTQLQSQNIYPEMEFLFAKETHFVKGFIDLVFCLEDKYYFVDWKTNWLNELDPMDAHHYWLQASIYNEALERYFSSKGDVKPLYTFGGAIYVFLRGPKVYFFKPKPFTLYS